MQLSPRPAQEAVSPSTVELLASAARTSSGQGAAVEIHGKELIVTLDVTVVSGTSPTLDVKLEHSPDGAKWTDLGAAFAQKTTAGREAKAFTQLHGFVRVNFTIAGTTPSFTFSVEATTRP